LSVFAYVGFPGSGKSYSVVEQQILPALRAGRTVVTNMPMKVDLLRAEVKSHGGQDCDIRSFDIARALADPNTILEDVPAGAVWVVDEVYKLFPAGTAVSKVPDPFKQILAEHRHRVDANGDSMQVVFVCQDLAQIAAFARQLVETTFRTTKLTAVGMHKRFRVDVFNGPVQGANPPVSARLREIPGRYDSKIYRYYISHTLSESAKEGANEVAIDRRANVLLRPLMIMAPIFIVVAGGLAVYHLYKRKDAVMHPGDSAKGTIASMSTLQGPKVVGPPAPPQGPPAPVVQGPRFAVRGYVRSEEHPEKSMALLVDGKVALERPYSRCFDGNGELVCEFRGHLYGEGGPLSVAAVTGGGGPPIAPYSADLAR
jgi:zona occludens toxin